MEFLLTAVIVIIMQGCSAVQVILQPTDMARELGKNATLACIVTGKTSSESVQWKHKPVASDAFNALTFNENVLSSASKYGIQWTYNLTVYNLQPADAGLYRCTAGGVDYDATLVVVDLPDNVTIEMVGQPNNGESHNITCKATNSLPPPTVRWLINGVDVTSNAVTTNTTLPGTGYADVSSYLQLSLDESMNGRGVECILSYRGWDNAVEATYTIQTLYPGGLSNSGTGFYNSGTIVFPSIGSKHNYSSLANGGSGVSSKGMFLVRFIKHNRNENIDFEIQQYAP